MSKSALDGVFTYILATIDQVVFAKDRWAIKPLAWCRGGIGSHGDRHRGAGHLRSIFVDEVDVVNYDGPSAVPCCGKVQRQAVPA